MKICTKSSFYNTIMIILFHTNSSLSVEGRFYGRLSEFELAECCQTPLQSLKDYRIGTLRKFCIAFVTVILYLFKEYSVKASSDLGCQRNLTAPRINRWLRCQHYSWVPFTPLANKIGACPVSYGGVVDFLIVKGLKYDSGDQVAKFLLPRSSDYPAYLTFRSEYAGLEIQDWIDCATRVLRSTPGSGSSSTARGTSKAYIKRHPVWSSSHTILLRIQ